MLSFSFLCLLFLGFVILITNILLSFSSLRDSMGTRGSVSIRSFIYQFQLFL